jgi:C-terminal processing protease CtpA/Prc
MRATRVFAAVAMCISSISAGERGIVGIGVDAAPDFSVITRVVADSPAAHAGVNVGDRILAIDGHPTSQMHSAQELVGRAAGAPDTQVELQLERGGTAQPLQLRMRRVPTPTARRAPTPIPDPSGYQASGHANGLTRRCS